MRNRSVWFLVMATAVCGTSASVNDGVKDVVAKSEQDRQQQQQQSDAMQTMADGGVHQQPVQTSADDYFAGPPLQLGSFGYLDKRAHKQYGFGLGKRLHRQYEFGLGKRAASRQYGFGLGKRAALKQYGFGLGKRASPTFYSFGLGRRASPQYSFGLGKRVSRPSYLNVDDKDADYTYSDLSEEKKRTSDDMERGQRFAFGLGKRVSSAEWDGVDGGGGNDDGDLTMAPISWHPAVRRARLQYGFGLGKRAEDYDETVGGIEYPEVRSTDDAANVN